MCTSVAQFPKNLRFGLDGEFKILQVSNCVAGAAMNLLVAEQVSQQIRMEDPQLVIFTFGGYGEVDVEALIPSLKSICKDVPFAIVSQDSKSMILPINDSSDSSVAEILYLISGDITYNTVLNHHLKSKEKREANGGAPVPSVAFILKPLPEYQEAYDEYGTKKNNGKQIFHTGNKTGTITSPEENYGLFTSMHEAGDVNAVFCGYDDGNDFAVVWKNIMLAYGRNSRTGGSVDFGVRVIILKEKGTGMLTYIRTADNAVVDKCEYPSDFPVIN